MLPWEYCVEKSFEIRQQSQDELFPDDSWQWVSFWLSAKTTPTLCQKVEREKIRRRKIERIFFIQ